MIDFLRRLLELRLDYISRRQQLREVAIRFDYRTREDEQTLLEQQTHCESCETLRLELSRAHDENMRLIDILLTKPEETRPANTEEFKPITMKRHIPFAVRRQILEEEDRAKARSAADQKKAATETVVDESLTVNLEKELDIVTNEREAESGQRVNEQG